VPQSEPDWDDEVANDSTTPQPNGFASSSAGGDAYASSCRGGTWTNSSFSNRDGSSFNEYGRPAGRGRGRGRGRRRNEGFGMAGKFSDGPGGFDRHFESGNAGFNNRRTNPEDRGDEEQEIMTIPKSCIGKLIGKLPGE